MASIRRNPSTNEHEKDMEHLVKCVGIIFSIQDSASTSGTNGSVTDGMKPKNSCVGNHVDVKTKHTENQPRLPYRKGAITEILRSLGFSIGADNPDNKRLVEAIFPPKRDHTKGDGHGSFAFKHQAKTEDQSNSKQSLPASSNDARRNFTPSRPKQRRFSPPRSIGNESPSIFAIQSPTRPGTVNREAVSPMDAKDYTILNAFCKKLSANPTGVFQNNLQAYNSRRNETPAAASDQNQKNNLKADSGTSKSMNLFKTAYEQMVIDDKARGIKRPRLPPPGTSSNVHVSGLRRLPKPDNNNDSSGSLPKKVCKTDSEEVSENPEVQELMLDERLKNVDSKMVEAILNEIIEVETNTQWDDIAGLKGPKDVIREIIIWPLQRPDIFTGLRGPPKGVLLFGPPGTGKTMIGRLIATQSKSTFFNISASSLTSKWIGDGEKMVRALFQIARVKQPAVIFIDEIDSILTQRSDTEHESSRRLKTEFLIQFDGCGTATDDRILVIGVTNRPRELDEAARRRLVKRIYIPLPDMESRKHLVKRVLMGQNAELNEEDFEKIAEMTDGYSGADMSSLVREAAYGPIRDIGHDIENINVDNVRPIQLKDFESAFKRVKASVAAQDLSMYEDWDKQFGCHV